MIEISSDFRRSISISWRAICFPVCWVWRRLPAVLGWFVRWFWCVYLSSIWVVAVRFRIRLSFVGVPGCAQSSCWVPFLSFRCYSSPLGVWCWVVLFIHWGRKSPGIAMCQIIRWWWATVSLPSCSTIRWSSSTRYSSLWVGWSYCLCWRVAICCRIPSPAPIKIVSCFPLLMCWISGLILSSMFIVVGFEFGGWFWVRGKIAGASHWFWGVSSPRLLWWGSVSRFRSLSLPTVTLSPAEMSASGVIKLGPISI